MLIVFILTISLFLLFFLYTKRRNNYFLISAILLNTGWLILELISYVYLLSVAYAGGNFFLIGNQKFLDEIIKFRLIQQISTKQAEIDGVYQLDPDLGWTLGQNKTYENAPASNSQRFRADKDYPFTPSADTFRIAVFGDSFVFGDNEKTADTWPYIVEKNIGNTEVLNFGISGYGLGQSYLRYLKDGLKFHPDLIVFNYLIPTERDYLGAQSIFEGIPLTRADLYRVNFEIKDGQLASKAIDPLDWFNADLREKLVFKPYGISSRSAFWSWKIFSVSNILLSIKQKYAGRTYLKLIYDKKPSGLREKNYLMLKNLFDTARKNNTSILFFYQYPREILPPETRQLLDENTDIVSFYFNVPLVSSLKKHYGYTNDDMRLSNRTGHYNAIGNKIFAESFMKVLVSKPWGAGERIFAYHPVAQKFIRIKK